jgi:hypothetical protein
MNVGGNYTFDAPQELVWQALLDPDVLASVMPGGEGFEEVGENEYAGNLKIKVGPVQGKFTGNIKLSDIVAPQSYIMVVDGKGAPGFVKASGKLQLSAQGENTHMSYEGTAQIGGRIASVGQRLLDASAKSIIRQSLDGLNAYLVAKNAATQAASDTMGSAETGLEQAPRPAVPEYTPPSQTAVAVKVARDVVGDVVPPKIRPALIAAVAVVIVVILYLLIT